MPWADLFLSSLLLPMIFLQFPMYLISEGVIFCCCCCSFGSNIERYRRCLHWHSSLKHTDITELLACFQTLCSGWYLRQLDKYKKNPQVTFREVSGEWKHPFNYLCLSVMECVLSKEQIFLKLGGFSSFANLSAKSCCFSTESVGFY